MSKIITREEVILEYLKHPVYLHNALTKGDVESNGETKQAILDLGVAKYAYLYSLRCAKYPDDELRLLACKDPAYACSYARFIDKNPMKETEEAVKYNDYWRRFYKEWFRSAENMAYYE